MTWCGLDDGRHPVTGEPRSFAPRQVRSRPRVGGDRGRRGPLIGNGRLDETDPMPIDYRRDDRRRLITVTVTEPFSFDDLLDQVDRQWADQAWDYAVFYDARAIDHFPPTTDIRRLIERARAVGGGRHRGVLGLAIPPRPEMLRGGLRLGPQSGRPSDIEVLLTEAQLADWLGRHAFVRADSPDQ
jgi:hypothetical protein